jgi:DNA-binding transcriptional regulator YiaG
VSTVCAKVSKATELVSRPSPIVAFPHGSRHSGTMTSPTATDAAAAVARAIHLRRALPPPSMRRALREANGISAAQLAGTMGVTRQAVSKWELGRRSPSGPLLEAYVAVLDELAASLRDAS